MSNSWGHAIRRLTDGERDQQYRLGYRCSGKCTEKATFATSYRYVTGRAGRVSWAERYACDTHAQRFAAKHDLELPTEAAEAQVHATRVALGQVFDYGKKENQ